MLISVIIPTYNGANKIIALLRSLEDQTFKEFEVIVVIDGSTDNTVELLKDNNFRLSLHIINRQNGGRAVARNTGAGAAKGDLLLFFDDDVRPKENCIAIHHQHHIQFLDTMLVGALTSDPSRATSDFSKYRYYLETIWQKPFNEQFVRISLDNYIFTTQNLSIQKAMFYQLGKFDERLKDSEDFDLSMKAILQNVPIYFNSHAFAWHDDYTSIEAYIRRQREYVKSKQYLLKLKPQYIQLHPASFKRGEISYLKKALGDLFVYNQFWNFTLHSQLFIRCIPQAIRFRLYSLIIHMSSIQNF